MTVDAEQQMAFLFALRQRGVTDKRVLEAMEDRESTINVLNAEAAAY